MEEQTPPDPAEGMQALQKSSLLYRKLLCVFHQNILLYHLLSCAQLSAGQRIIKGEDKSSLDHW